MLPVPLLVACLISRRSALAYFALMLVMLAASAAISLRATFPAYLPSHVQILYGFFNFTGVSILAMGCLIYFIHLRTQAMRLLAAEQQKSETLLLNILPRKIAIRLKAGESPIADRVFGASVLFADMVGFTPLSAAMAPERLVALLSDVFSVFDEISAKYGLEKIKIIGDCYMIAAGVPEPRDDHARVLAQLALDLRDAISVRTFGGQTLEFRIGIHSGPVVAGVIGKSKIAYDLYGDTVNLASRMESHGTPNAIQVTEQTYREIRDHFLLESRGEVAVKGKGNLRTWYLLSPKPV
jgi:guanylate cyclase